MKLPTALSILLKNLLLLLLVSITTKAIGNTQPNDPTNNTIFQSIVDKEVVDLTIEMDLDLIVANKNTNTYQPANVTINKAGINILHEVKVRPRGRSRRKYCEFPPLKLKFSKEGLANLGLNTSYKTVKLVTHCTNDGEAMRNILEEHLAYQLYNVLTDNSFKSQLVKVTYIDSKTGESFKRFGIILENTKEMTARLEGEGIEQMGTPLEAYDKAQYNLMAVFQYMIGNEDWRLEFLRNAKLVKNKEGKILAIPYDFDASGLVNASYAKPDADLRLETVLQRQFMGNFNNKAERKETINYVLSKKEALLQTVQDLPYMDTSNRKVALQYVQSFFDIIENRRSLYMTMPLRGKTPLVSNDKGILEL